MGGLDERSLGHRLDQHDLGVESGPRTGLPIHRSPGRHRSHCADVPFRRVSPGPDGLFGRRNPRVRRHERRHHGDRFGGGFRDCQLSPRGDPERLAGRFPGLRIAGDHGSGPRRRSRSTRRRDGDDRFGQPGCLIYAGRELRARAARWRAIACGHIDGRRQDDCGLAPGLSDRPHDVPDGDFCRRGAPRHGHGRRHSHSRHRQRSDVVHHDHDPGADDRTRRRNPSG